MRGHRRVAVAGTLSIGLVLVASLLFLLAFADHDRAAAKAARLPEGHAVVTVGSPLLSRAVPRSFLGLSTEYWALTVYERDMSALERVVSMLRIRGDGPFLVRIGGDSADYSFWSSRGRSIPRWGYAVTPVFLRTTRTLIRRADVRLMLDLNLITGTPERAAQWAAAARGGLPRGSVLAFEVGNEPDIYNRRDWLAALAETPLRAPFLHARLSASTYVADFEAYARAVHAVAPGVPLAGPALASPVRHVGWISALLRAPRAGLGIVTAHRYLFSACVRRRSAGYPTVARLLSNHASGGMAAALSPAIALAHRARLQFRMTELNSVTCRGVPGISDAFVTALWAPDALFELLKAGVDGVNIHVRTNAVNAAFTLGAGGLAARPLLYGLSVFAATLNPSPRLLGVRVRESRRARIKAWAVRVRGGMLHVLVINKRRERAVVTLRLPAEGAAVAQRLLAPSPLSRSRVTFGGRWIGRDGRWHGRPLVSTLAADRSGYRLRMPGMSAALLTVQLAAPPRHVQGLPGSRKGASPSS